jgi:hypothetical protein
VTSGPADDDVDARMLVRSRQPPAAPHGAVPSGTGIGEPILESPMSMYTQLLDVAFARRVPLDAGPTTRSAVEEVLECRAELGRGGPSDDDPDMVPVVLAQQIDYDVALLRLARVVGIVTDPRRFEQPQKERERLEHVFRDLGINLEEAAGWEEPVPGRP